MSNRRTDPVEVRITARFVATRPDGVPVRDAASLAELDGHRLEARPLSAYLHHPLPEVVQGGELSLLHRAGEDHLRAVTSYVASRRLQPAELQALVKDTRARWTTGLGESLVVSLRGAPATLAPDLDALELRSEQRHVPGLKVPRESPIFAAIDEGDVDRARALAAQGHVTAWDRHGSSPLKAAVVRQATDLALALIQLDPHPGARTHELIHAARMGDAAVVRALLAAGVRPDTHDAAFGVDGPHGRFTALMAAANGATGFAGPAAAQETVGALLTAGARPSLASPDTGKTPLHWAQQAAVVRQLLAAGADPSRRDADGLTPLEHHDQQRRWSLEGAWPDAAKAAIHADIVAALQAASAP